MLKFEEKDKKVDYANQTGHEIDGKGNQLISLLVEASDILAVTSFSFFPRPPVILSSLAGFVDNEQAEVLCHEPNNGGELATLAQLLGMGLLAALVARVEQH